MFWALAVAYVQTRKRNDMNTKEHQLGCVIKEMEHARQMKNDRRDLLLEIIEQIREGLPEGTDVEAWIEDPEHLFGDDPIAGPGIEMPNGRDFLAYHYGQLLGAAQWEGLSVRSLLHACNVIIEPLHKKTLHETVQHLLDETAYAEDSNTGAFGALRYSLKQALRVHRND
jgi:hypothetical protein